MENDVEVHGTLENWTGYFNGTIVGNINGDTKGRFEDGHLVRTSTVLKTEGDIIYTRNSVYKLGEPMTTTKRS